MFLPNVTVTATECQLLMKHEVTVIQAEELAILHSLFYVTGNFQNEYFLRSRVFTAM